MLNFGGNLVLYILSILVSYCKPRRKIYRKLELQILRSIYEDGFFVILPTSSRSDFAKMPTLVYSCRKCRKILFDDSIVIAHSAAASKTCFSTKHLLKNETEASNISNAKCTSLFIEAMPWMGDVSCATGKLFCSNQNCRSKVGSWCWYGSRCSCGAWQVPAFQILTSKVDRLKHHPSTQ